MAFRRTVVEAGLAHLRRDADMRQLIEQVGPFALRTERDRFGILVRSIISQQISTKAARSIRLRLQALVAPDRLTPENILALPDEALRGAGLSPQKLVYIRDLCAHVSDGRVCLRTIGRLSDEEVIESLVTVKGIGRWTAQMFLIFSLGRPDVLAHDDLGIRAALKRMHGLEELPDKATCLRLAEPWRPYASIASWYCWRSGDLPKENGKPT